MKRAMTSYPLSDEDREIQNARAARSSTTS